MGSLWIVILAVGLLLGSSLVLSDEMNNSTKDSIVPTEEMNNSTTNASGFGNTDNPVKELDNKDGSKEKQKEINEGIKNDKEGSSEGFYGSDIYLYLGILFIMTLPVVCILFIYGMGVCCGYGVWKNRYRHRNREPQQGGIAFGQPPVERVFGANSSMFENAGMYPQQEQTQYVPQDPQNPYAYAGPHMGSYKNSKDHRHSNFKEVTQV